MIIKLLNKNYSLIWVLLHALLGAAATTGNVYVILWFYSAIFISIYLLSFRAVNRPLLIASTMVYIGAFELLARMTKCSPIIPWEASKYLFTIFSVTGIFLTGKKSIKASTGWWIILLVIPSLFIDKSGMADSGDVIFNVMGLINIGLGIIFFSSMTVSKERYIDLIRLIVFPCISILTYTIIKTPDLKDISFSLGAQAATSGDFGSNQVSTVLGLGFAIMSISAILNWRITQNRITDGLTAILFLVQGLFTFSRGGMIGGALAVLSFIFFYFYFTRNSTHINKNVKRVILPAFAIVVAAIIYTNELTEGQLFLRYQGETYGTITGTKDKDLNTLTSNRNIIFLSDLELWREYPVFGTGAGTSKYLRSEGSGMAAHIELSRLLAEHGIPGIIIFILILRLGYENLRERDGLIRALKCGIFILAIYTTFHSATRTFITPLLISLSVLNIYVKPHSNDPIPGK